jgi:hypothetical protein
MSHLTWDGIFFPSGPGYNLFNVSDAGDGVGILPQPDLRD